MSYWDEVDPDDWWVEHQSPGNVKLLGPGTSPVSRIDRPRPSVGFRGFPKNRERTLTVVCNSNRANCGFDSR